MNRICFFIPLFCAIVLSGCQEQQKIQPAKPSIEGIKLGDLAGGSDQKAPPQVCFRVFTFETPIERVDALRQVFDLMSRRQIQFADRDGFDANGFLVGFGTQQEWSALSAELEKLDARKIATNNIVIHDEGMDDLPMSLLNSTRDVAWVGKGDKAVRDTFAAGRFMWKLKARPMGSVRGVAQVELVPIYKIGTQSLLSHLAKVRDSVSFPFGGISVRMAAGDYVLIGSGGEPVGSDGQAIGALTLNRLLFYPAERPDRMRLLVILCAKVQD